jgi:hypothetical protein
VPVLPGCGTFGGASLRYAKLFRRQLADRFFVPLKLRIIGLCVLIIWFIAFFPFEIGGG